MPRVDGRPTMRDIHQHRVLGGRTRDQRPPKNGARSMSVLFMEKVEIIPGGCWNWRGRLSAGGYGQYRAAEGGAHHAHRVSYLIFKGPLTPGLEIDHLCENRACVNPDHLEEVTQEENARRSSPGWLACDVVHPATRTRVGTRSDGRRYCLECQRVREADRRARFAEQEQEKATRIARRHNETP